MNAFDLETAYRYGSAELKAAVEQAPVRMLPEEVINRAREAVSREADPAGWAEVDLVEDLGAAITSLVSSVRATLGDDESARVLPAA